MLQAFINYLNNMVGCSLYVWGGQGESIKSIVKEWISKKETSTVNANRAFSLLEKLLKQNLFFYDCSGLGVAWLLEQGVIKTDMTANNLYTLCKKVNRSELKKGDWVFILNNRGIATHIGYIVDEDLNVVESAGRNYGVIKRSMYLGSPNGGWNAYGRPEGLFSELGSNLESEGRIIFNRLLKLTSPRMQGRDVLNLQTAIGAVPDGIFGVETEEKLILKQKQLFQSNPNEWDGKAGKNTISALGFVWLG